jgi:hypothetical protein
VGLHDELVAESKGGACKVCTFLARLDPATRSEWENELALPVETITHAAIVVALKRRSIPIEEASVRRHRKNHVSR